jgi:hypothetical protein
LVDDAAERAASLLEGGGERDSAEVAAAEERAAEIIAAAEVTAAELVDDAAERAAEMLSGAEANQGDGAGGTDELLERAQTEATTIIETAREEASEIKAAAIAALREANDVMAAAEAEAQTAGSSEDDAAALAAAELAARELDERAKQLEDREFALQSREHAVAVREREIEETLRRGDADASDQRDADVYAIPVSPVASSESQTNGNGHSGTDQDSIDAIRREALAALQASRSDGWDEPRAAEIPQEVFAGAAIERPTMDYSPSVPPPVHDSPADESDSAPDVRPAEVESRYSRNSAKLPRLGIDPSSASSSIANLRKQLKSNDD